MSTSPKNWYPPAGETLAVVGAFTHTRSGPNVASSSVAGNAPALSGPETNSQNGSKSPNAARAGW